MTSAIRWYGYLHNNGTLHVRRYIGDFGESDIEECRASPFVREVFGPFDARTQHLAKLKLDKLAESAP